MGITERKMLMKPSDILYSADSVSCQLRESGYSVGATLDMYCEGKFDIKSIRPLRVKKVNEKYITFNNRHLWIYKQLERLWFLTEIPIEVSDQPLLMLNRKEGKTITIEGEPGGVWYKNWSTPEKAQAIYTAAVTAGVALLFLL